jgi:hypothetical protein
VDVASPDLRPPAVDVKAVTAGLALTGTHCSSCVELIVETFAECDGGTMAVVIPGSAVGCVTYDPATVTAGDLCAPVLSDGCGARRLKELGP